MQIHGLFSSFPAREMLVPDIPSNTATARRLRAAALSRSGFAALLAGLLAVTAVVPVASAQTAAAASRPKSAAVTTGSGLDVIPGSFKPTMDADMGEFSSAKMTVQVVLAPTNQAELDSLLADVYNPNSSSYQQWLAQGEFNARFAPSSEQIAAVAAHLQSSGLVIEQSASPFLVRASGPSSQVEAAFATTLHNYRNSKGITYFTNTSAVQLPSSVSAGVLGVVGLSNTVRSHPLYRRIPNSMLARTTSCDSPYPSLAYIVDLYIDGTSLPYGYGGGPGCSGLTPSQTNSIYGAPDVGPFGKGAGVNLAVFELSAYQHSDIATWAHQFYGPSYTPPLVDIDVDSGPLGAFCPTGDTCYPGYGGDIEVDADIEMQLTVAPDARRILVYNAPNDFTGQTSLDEYAKIANDNRADVISSSWGVCENDLTAGYVQAENLVFEQMAAQGQSMFAAAGDSGAFTCIGSDGTTIVNIGDPAEPWVTVVGGTSFDYNPNVNPHPSYPNGLETVWNVDNLCNESSNSEHTGVPGLDWCAATGAGGGGNSQFWGRPFYQSGPGITNRYSTYGGEVIPNGVEQCTLARKGKPCREVPDISANADDWTGYAEYCTGSASTPGSTCALFSSSQPAPGWFQVGGTSLSSPLWSAIIADRVGYQGHRVGNANPLLYQLYNLDYQGYFNDITGIEQKTNNNGLFPTTPGYDLATGIGTPKMAALITGSPQY